MPVCPQGHDSSSADFCEICGCEMSAPQGSPCHGQLKIAEGTKCPICASPKGGGDFCEICGYNFVTASLPIQAASASAGASSAPEVSAPTPPGTADATPAPAADAAVSSITTPTQSPAGSAMPTPAAIPNLGRWELRAAVDVSVEGAPPSAPERVFPLDMAVSLIGRRSTKRNIVPEISLDDDDGVSHRHASLLRQPDGSFTILDLGSSNGMTLNGVSLQPNVPAALAAGDKLRLGRWTMLSITRI